MVGRSRRGGGGRCRGEGRKREWKSLTCDSSRREQTSVMHYEFALPSLFPSVAENSYKQNNNAAPASLSFSLVAPRPFLFLVDVLYPFRSRNWIFSKREGGFRNPYRSSIGNSLVSFLLSCPVERRREKGDMADVACFSLHIRCMGREGEAIPMLCHSSVGSRLKGSSSFFPFAFFRLPYLREPRMQSLEGEKER